MDTIAQAIDMEKLRKDIDANKALLIAQMEIALIDAGAVVREDVDGFRYAYIGTKQICEVGAVLLELSHPDFEKLRSLVDITSDRYHKRMRELFDIGVVAEGDKSLLAAGQLLCLSDVVVDADDATFEKLKAEAIEMLQGSQTRDKQLFFEYITALLAVPRPAIQGAAASHAVKNVRNYIMDARDGITKNGFV